MAKKRVLACDFDDVINNFNVVYNLYNRIAFGAEVTYENLHTYDYTVDYGITEEESHNRIFTFCHNYHDSVRPLQNAIDGLRKLKRRFDIHIVTSRCESIADVTNTWLDKQAPNLFVDSHFTNGFSTKHPERRRKKIEVCKQIGAVGFIDDSLSHVGEIASGMGIPVFMPTRPWNRREEPEGVTRVSGFGEIIKGLRGV